MGLDSPDKSEKVKKPESGSAEKVPPVLTNKVATQIPLDLDSVDADADADERSGDQRDTNSGTQSRLRDDTLRHPDSVHIFDLFKHWACVATLVLLTALIVYYVSFSLPIGETYVAGMPYWLFALVGTVVAVIVWLLNHLAKVPALVSAGLALVAGAVGMAAAHPALLRLNALTDHDNVQVVEYMRTSENRFEPVTGDWPRINMIGRQYWLMVPGEVRRAIPIRRGGLGFYQADLTEIRFELELSEAFGEPE